MLITARTLAETLGTAAEETGRLRVFIDDLDGWDGQDSDTGTNAMLTLDAMARATAAIDADAPLEEALDVAITAGMREGVGHVGVLLTIVLSAWARGLPAATKVTPLTLRRMLQSNPWDVEEASMEWTVAVEAMFDEATSELDTLGANLPEVEGVITAFSSQAQYGLVNATSERTGRVDAGAAVLAVLFACLDATVRHDHAMLGSLAQMLADLAGSPGAASPRPQAPAPGRAFTVDILLHGTPADARATQIALASLATRYSMVGIVDVFGVGEWRIHADTSAPLAVRPRVGTVMRFQVSDARPDDLIGLDTLSDGVTHRGVQLLERRTLRRVERANVIAYTRAPGLVEDLAQAGAIVFLNPEPGDTDSLLGSARRSTTGVSLIAPCDEDSAATARSLASALVNEPAFLPGTRHPMRLLVAGSTDDLSALAISQACGTLFVPQPGGPAAAPIIEPMLDSTAHQALQNSGVVPVSSDLPSADLAQAVRDVIARQPRHMRVLVNRTDGPDLVALLRQVLIAAPHGEFRGLPDLEPIDGGQDGPSLLQGTR